MKSIIVLLILSMTISGCYSTYSSASNTIASNNTRRQLPPWQYYVDVNSDGIFDEVQLEQKPEPTQGNDQWIRDFYGSIKYPVSARERGISGIVVLEILVNEFGVIDAVSIKKSLRQDCDEEARRALLSSTQQGFIPLIYSSNPVKFMVDIPVGFWLQ